MGAREGRGAPAGVARPNPAWEQWAGQGLALCHGGRALLPLLRWPACAFGCVAVYPELHGLVWPCVCCRSVCPCIRVSVCPCVHASMGLCTHMLVHPCIRVTICLCVLASVHPCIHLSLHLCVHASMYPYIPASVYPCIHTSMCPCISVSICPCIHVSMHLYTCAPVTPCACVSDNPCVHPSVYPCACIHESIYLYFHMLVYPCIRTCPLKLPSILHRGQDVTMQVVVAAGGHIPETVASSGCPCSAPNLLFPSPGAVSRLEQGHGCWGCSLGVAAKAKKGGNNCSLENRRKSPGHAVSPGVGPRVPRGHPVIIPKPDLCCRHCPGTPHTGFGQLCGI